MILNIINSSKTIVIKNASFLSETCKNIKCSAGKACIIRNGLPKCACSPNCKILRQLALAGTHKRGPICGSDGRTYKSTCRMMTKSCRQRVSLSIAYYGSCQCKQITLIQATTIKKELNSNSNE